MPLGTLDRTPPPFFRQGPSALTKLVFFSALALFLMVADARFRVVGPLRSALGTALLPLQSALAVPVQMWEGGGQYLQGLGNAVQAEQQARQSLAQLAEKAARVEALKVENERLRALLELRPSVAVRTQAAQVLYEAADPYSRKVFIDRGSSQGVALGSPVINEAGVLGQVTGLTPFSAEVTLITDRDAVVPVINSRTQQRSAAFGGAGGGANPGMDLRFMAGNADVQAGDLLATSGLDGIYPPGLPVARVVSVDRQAEAGFARIALQPAALPDGVRHVLVLEPVSAQIPIPATSRAAPRSAGGPVGQGPGSAAKGPGSAPKGSAGASR